MTTDNFGRRYLNALTGSYRTEGTDPASLQGYSFGRRYLAALFHVDLPSGGSASKATHPEVKGYKGSKLKKQGERPTRLIAGFVGALCAVLIGGAVLFPAEAASLAMGFVGLRYGAMALVGLTLMSVGIKSKSSSVASVGAVVLCLLLVSVL